MSAFTCFQYVSSEDIDRIIEMAWEDRTPFEAIEYQFNLKENAVRAIMREHLKEKSFKRWRKHVKGRKTKHASLREEEVKRFKCSRQRHISSNRIT